MKRTLTHVELSAAAIVAAQLNSDALVSVLAHFAGFGFDQVNDAQGRLRAPWRNFALLVSEVLANECTDGRTAQRIRRRVDKRPQPTRPESTVAS